MDAKRYDVKNSKDPTPGNITEEKESELEEFVDYARIVMGTLGHKIFEPIVSSKSMKNIEKHNEIEEPLLFFTAQITMPKVTVLARALLSLREAHCS